MIKYIGKKVREEKGFTVRGLAEKSGLAPSTISKWENNASLPDLEALDKAAVALGVKPWNLIAYNGLRSR